MVASHDGGSRTIFEQRHKTEDREEKKKHMRADFRAFVVNQTSDGFKMGVERLSLQDLPPGEVLIQVAYAAMNFFPLSSKLDCKQALVLSAGTTAMMGLHQLEKNGLTPQLGPVLVTGATGGVGSLAVSLLSRRGYKEGEQRGGWVPTRRAAHLLSPL